MGCINPCTQQNNKLPCANERAAVWLDAEFLLKIHPNAVGYSNWSRGLIYIFTLDWTKRQAVEIICVTLKFIWCLSFRRQLSLIYSALVELWFLNLHIILGKCKVSMTNILKGYKSPTQVEIYLNDPLAVIYYTRVIREGKNWESLPNWRVYPLTTVSLLLWIHGLMEDLVVMGFQMFFLPPHASL